MGSVAIIEPDDGGTITASSSASGTTPEALLRVQPTDVWQPTGKGTHWIQQDRSAAVAFDTVALLFTSMTIGGAWRVRAASTVAGLTDGTAEYDSGQMSFWSFANSARQPRRHLYHRLPAPMALRCRRVDVIDNANPFTAGRLVVGLAWEPIVRFGLTRGYEGGLTETETVGGQVVLDRQEARPSLAMEMIAETRAEFDRHALALQQFNREVLIAVDAADAQYRQQRLYYGVMQGRGVADDDFEFWRHRIELRGLL